METETGELVVTIYNLWGFFLFLFAMHVHLKKVKSTFLPFLLLFKIM